MNFRRAISFVFLFSFPSVAGAVVKPLVIMDGARAVILLQGISAGHPLDPDARELYDQIALEPRQVQGGEGKGLKTNTGDFNWSCVVRPALPEDAICSFTVQKSARSVVSAGQKRVEIQLEGADAHAFFWQLTGNSGVNTFLFENSTRQIRIEATNEKFSFVFVERP